MEVYRFKALLFTILMGITLPGLQVQAMFEVNTYAEDADSSLSVSDDQNSTYPHSEQESRPQITTQLSSTTQPETSTPENQSQPGLIHRLKSSVGTFLSRNSKNSESSWLGKIGNADVIMPEKTKEDLLELIATFTKNVKEAFQGSNDLLILKQMSDDVIILQTDITFFSSSTSDADLKRSASQQKQSLNYQEFYNQTIQPKLKQIEKKYEELANGLRQLQIIGNKPKKADDPLAQALIDKEKSLAKIKEILIILLPDSSASQSGLGITPSSNLSGENLDLGIINAILHQLNESIQQTSNLFKESDSGISEAMSKHIDSFTSKLNTIVHSLASEFKAQLREVVGYSGLIKLHAKIEALLLNISNLDDNHLRADLLGLEKNLIEIKIDLKATDIHSNIANAHEKLKKVLSAQEINRENITESLQNAKNILSQTIDTKGGLAAVIKLMETKLLKVTDHFADRVSQKFAENVVDRSAKKLDHAVEQSIPKMAKKVVGYGIFGALAYTSLKWLYLKDKPTSYEWGKGLGGFIGSIACIPLVDTFINKCYSDT